MRLYVLFIMICMSCYTANGQTPVAVEPALEHLLKYPNIRDFTMSSSGDEAYISLQSPLGEISVLARIKKLKNAWSEPEVVSFSGVYKDLEPFLSKNDLRLYFASNRPFIDSIDQAKDFDIWFVERERTDSDWGEPVNLGAPVNTTSNEYYPSVAQNGNIYFTSDGLDSKGKDDIFYSSWSDDAYSAPSSLSDSINTDGYEFNAYIAHDESYLIFGGYNREDGMGSGDLYISFRDKNLVWQNAVNLGEHVNSRYMDYCPFVDTGSATLYFTSKRSAINDINNFQSLGEVLEEINKSENGFSRIYRVSIGEVLSGSNNDQR
jgi:WD40-like Beta Propeller Repeat